MNAVLNKLDPFGQLIFEEGLRIEAIHIHQELDRMLIVLNTKAVLRHSLSLYPTLKSASQDELKQFELIADGTGVHWPL
ncbi:MAG: hypothetical protein JWQ40_3026 [Segetibacter sp.]|nr:hypothetical protein [Segetibacter sp.]